MSGYAAGYEIVDAGGPGGGGVAISASNSLQTSGTISFANGGGVSFGLNAGTMTASVNAAGAAITVSDAATSGTIGRLAFTNLNGVTLSLSTGAGGSHTIVGSHNALTSQSNQAFSADAMSNFQTLVFQDSNGISFSNNAGSLRVTHGLQFTSATSAITSAALHTSASRVINIVANTNNTAGGTASLSSNVSFSAANGLTFYTSAGNAIVGSYTVPTVTNSSMTVSDAATSGTLARLAFTNLNGVTLSLSTGAGGSHTIVGSHNALTSQSNQAFSADAMSNFQTLVFQDSNGVSFSNNAGSLRITHGLQFTSNTSAITSNAMHSTSRPAFSADASSTFQTLTFQNSNGISFSNNAGAVRLTHDLQYTSNTSNITSNALHSTKSNLTIYAGSNTVGATSGTVASNSFNLSGAGIASVQATNGGWLVSVPAGGGAGDGVNVVGVSTGGNTAGNTGTTLSGTYVFEGASSLTLSQVTGGGGVHTISFVPPMSQLTAGGGISLSTNGSTITVSNLIAVGVSNTGNTTGNTRTTQQTIVFAGSNGITLSQSTGAANDTLWVVGDPHQSYHAIQPGAAVATLTFSFAQSTSIMQPFQISNNLSVGFLRLLASGSCAASSTQSTTGNTSYSMSAVTSHNLVLYSRGTGASSMSLQYIGSTQIVDQQLVTYSVAANSTQHSYSNRLTRGSLSTTFDYSSSAASMNWHTSNLTNFTGVRHFDLDFATSLPPGQYWLAYGRSTTSNTQNANISVATRMLLSHNSMIFVSQNTLVMGPMGAATNSSIMPLPAHGSFSTGGAGGTTSSVDMTRVSSGSSNQIIFGQFMRIA